MTNLNKSKEQIIYELLISMNNGDNACYDDRLQYAMKQYEQLVKNKIVVEECDVTICNDSDKQEKKEHIQIFLVAHNNYDILHNPHVKKMYPNLYKEIFEHDKISNSSWYELSSEAYEEYERYKKCNWLL